MRAFRKPLPHVPVLIHRLGPQQPVFLALFAAHHRACAARQVGQVLRGAHRRRLRQRPRREGRRRGVRRGLHERGRLRTPAATAGPANSSDPVRSTLLV